MCYLCGQTFKYFSLLLGNKYLVFGLLNHENKYLNMSLKNGDGPMRKAQKAFFVARFQPLHLGHEHAIKYNTL
jgi:hypothetical protein